MKLVVPHRAAVSLNAFSWFYYWARSSPLSWEEQLQDFKGCVGSAAYSVTCVLEDCLDHSTALHPLRLSIPVSSLIGSSLPPLAGGGRLQLCRSALCWQYFLHTPAFSTSGCSDDSPVLVPTSSRCNVLKWGRHLQLPGQLSMAFPLARCLFSRSHCHSNLMCDRNHQTSTDSVANRPIASYPKMSLRFPPCSTGMQLLSSLAQSHKAEILGKSKWPR